MKREKGHKKINMKMSDLSLRWRHAAAPPDLIHRQTANDPDGLEDTAVRYRTSRSRPRKHAKTARSTAAYCCSTANFSMTPRWQGSKCTCKSRPPFMQRRSHVALDERPHFRETSAEAATENAPEEANATRAASSEAANQAKSDAISARRRSTPSRYGCAQRCFARRFASGPRVVTKRTLASHKLQHVALDPDGSDDGRGGLPGMFLRRRAGRPVFGTATTKRVRPLRGLRPNHA